MINNKVRHFWGICAGIGFVAAMAGVTMLLWNALVPAIFGGVAITYLQAAGLLILSRLLFGGFGMGHLKRHAHRHCHPHDFGEGFGGHDHFHKMSRDERKEFIRRHMAGRGFFCDDKHETPEGERAE